MIKELIEKRGTKMVFTIVWLFFYLSFVNKYNLGEGAVNFIIYYLLIPAAISLAILFVERVVKRKKNGRETV
jgi:hypothetical protein